MSAQIPETMLLSDLLKPTGYDCPEDLQGKTFEEATTGGDAKISTNTAKTIDVSAYTEPVEVEPAEGYDATKKVTLTLSNIPSGGSSWYCWSTSSSTTHLEDETYIYLPFASAPDVIPLTTEMMQTTGGDSVCSKHSIQIATELWSAVVSATKVSANEIIFATSNVEAHYYRNEFLAQYDI